MNVFINVRALSGLNYVNPLGCNTPSTLLFFTFITPDHFTYQWEALQHNMLTLHDMLNCYHAIFAQLQAIVHATFR